MACMFLLIGAHQHVQVKAFRLALATVEEWSSIPPLLHSNHSQPQELQQLGEWAPASRTKKLRFTVVQNPWVTCLSTCLDRGTASSVMSRSSSVPEASVVS